eukprot:sb/3463770/
MSSVHHLFTWILAMLLIPVVLSRGTVKVEYRKFEYDGCASDSDCQMKITNFKLFIDGVVSESHPEIGLPAGNPVTLLNNANVPTLEDPFVKEFGDANGAVGIYFEMYDITSGSQLIDNVTENIGLYKYDMSTTVNWQVKARKRKFYNNYESEFIFWVEITKCGDNFTGHGCGDCTEDHFTAECDVFCKPVTDQYSCSAEGVRECLGNFGPAGDCKKCNKGWKGTKCDTCDIGWAGDKCDTCDTNYYPEGECSVLCIPTVMFNCNNQGERVCEPHVTGNNCESCEKEWDIGTNCTDCSDNYYPGGVCNVLCIPEARFNCLDTGEKSCSENYYPAGVCDSLCVPNFNFTCLATGEKACTEDSLAEECQKESLPVGAIGGGIGGILVILVIVIVVLVVLKWRGGLGEKKSASPVSMSTLQPQEDPAYSTVIKNRTAPEDSAPVYATVNKNLDEDPGPLYSTPDKSREPLYSTPSKGASLYSSPGNEEPLYADNDPADQYATVEFFGNRETLERGRQEREDEVGGEETLYARMGL